MLALTGLIPHLLLRTMLHCRLDGEPTDSTGVCRPAPCRYNDQN